MPKVTFSIIGLAVCYRKPASNEWTIIFPFDGDHKVLCRYRKRDGSYFDLGSLKNKNVTITAPGSIQPGSFADASFDKVLDMSKPYLHGEGINRRGPNKKWTIQNAVLSSLHERNDRYVTAYQFDNPNSSQPTNTFTVPFGVSDKIGGEIEIPAGGSVQLSVEGGNSYSIVAGESLEIDNFCVNCKRDYQMYENLYINKTKPQKRCDVISLMRPTFNIMGKITPKFGGDPPAFCDPIQIGGGDMGGLD